MAHVCPSWLSFVLYNPVRKACTNRKEILDESGITPGSVVLEVGSGNGFLTEVIAERAQKVVCVELQEGMIRKLKKRIQMFGNKVEIMSGDIASLTPGDAFADICLLYYTFHEVKNKPNAVKHISMALKINGTLSLYEPTVEVTKKDMQKSIELFERFGFQKEHERNSTFTRFVRLKKYQ
jgi:tRNA A58 N-methylase Trm61